MLAPAVQALPVPTVFAGPAKAERRFWEFFTTRANPVGKPGQPDLSPFHTANSDAVCSVPFTASPIILSVDDWVPPLTSKSFLYFRHETRVTQWSSGVCCAS